MDKSAGRIVALWFGCALFGAAHLVPAAAAVPHLMNFQGYLTNASGQPVSSTVTMVFNLYDAPAAPTALYSETQSVSVNNGIYVVAIGAVTALTLPFDVPYYLGIKVGADPEMTPRQPLMASPYALRAAGVDATAALPAVQITGAIGTTQLANSAVTPAKLSANYAGSASAGGAATTAVALAANGSNCAPGQFATGVDSQGNAEGCAAPASGTVTSITAGTGLSGGTITAAGTIAADTTYLQRRVSSSCTTGSYIRAIAADGSVTCGIDASGEFADFFALMLPDTAATVAIGGTVEFPQNGPSSGTIARLSAGQFLLPAIGTYQVMFQASVNESGQLAISVNGAPVPATTVGRAIGTSQIVGIALVTTTTVGSTLGIINNGSTSALTITPFAGGVNNVSAHLVITRLR